MRDLRHIDAAGGGGGGHENIGSAVLKTVNGLLALVLGADTGPSMVGFAYAPAAVFADMP